MERRKKPAKNKPLALIQTASIWGHHSRGRDVVELPKLVGVYALSWRIQSQTQLTRLHPLHVFCMS